MAIESEMRFVRVPHPLSHGTSVETSSPSTHDIHTIESETFTTCFHYRPYACIANALLTAQCKQYAYCMYILQYHYAFNYMYLQSVSLRKKKVKSLYIRHNISYKVLNNLKPLRSFYAVIKIRSILLTTIYWKLNIQSLMEFLKCHNVTKLQSYQRVLNNRNFATLLRGLKAFTIFEEFKR